MNRKLNTETCKVLITGGSGFIGTNLVESLISKNIEILNLDIVAPKNHKHKNLWQNISMLDFKELQKQFLQFNPDYVYHLAARTDLNGNNLKDYDVNIQGTKNIIEILKKLKKLKFVFFFSSRLVCKIGYQPNSVNDFCPDTSYGKSKMIGEKIIMKHSSSINFNWTILRPTSIWGPWFGIPYRTFFDVIKANKYFHPGNKKIYKSFGYVKNSVYQLNMLRNIEIDLINKKTFYLCDYKPIEVSEMANQIQKNIKSKKIKTLRYSFLKIIAGIGDFLSFIGWKNVPLTSFRLNNLTTEMLHDRFNLKSIIPELPFTMEDGIKETVKWINKTK